MTGKLIAPAKPINTINEEAIKKLLLNKFKSTVSLTNQLYTLLQLIKDKKQLPKTIMKYLFGMYLKPLILSTSKFLSKFSELRNQTTKNNK